MTFKYWSADYLAPKKNKFFRTFNRIWNNCDIDFCIDIPKGTKFEHYGQGVSIGGNTILGKGCHLHSNIVIGRKNDKSPKIGNNVTIYPNSVIVGGITIGDNSIIGACSFIDKDIPANSIVYCERKLVIKSRLKKNIIL